MTSFASEFLSTHFTETLALPASRRVERSEGKWSAGNQRRCLVVVDRSVIAARLKGLINLNGISVPGIASVAVSYLFTQLMLLILLIQLRLPRPTPKLHSTHTIHAALSTTQTVLLCEISSIYERTWMLSADTQHQTNPRSSFRD